MNDRALIFSVSVLLWVSLGYRFFRALGRRQVTRGTSLNMWAVLFLIYLGTVLTVDQIESAIDSHFGGLPVALMTRSLIAFAAAHLAYMSLGRLNREYPRLRWAFLRFSGLMAVALVLLFIGMAATHAVNPEEMPIYLKGLRDTVMIGWFTLMLMPPGLRMMQNEQTRPPRFRSLIVVTCFAALLIQFVSELVWIFMLVYRSLLASDLSEVERLSSYAAYLLFFALLIPYETLLIFFYPPLLWQYIRLRRLVSVMPPNPNRPPRRWFFANAVDLESAIYDQVIYVLDRYRMMPEDRPLRTELQHLIEQNRQYDDLARELARVRE